MVLGENRNTRIETPSTPPMVQRIPASRRGVSRRVQAKAGRTAATQTQWWDQETGLIRSMVSAVAEMATTRAPWSLAALMTTAPTPTTKQAQQEPGHGDAGFREHRNAAARP